MILIALTYLWLLYPFSPRSSVVAELLSCCLWLTLLYHILFRTCCGYVSDWFSFSDLLKENWKVDLADCCYYCCYWTLLIVDQQPRHKRCLASLKLPHPIWWMTPWRLMLMLAGRGIGAVEFLMIVFRRSYSWIAPLPLYNQVKTIINE